MEPETIEGLQQAAVVYGLDSQPSKEEISKAIHQIKPAKAPGSGGIPTEVLKVAEPVHLNRILPLFQQIWKTEKLPKDFKDAPITTIYKKGERSDCNNYRGISLLAIAGKISARFLLNRMVKHIADPNLFESQTGFRANPGTTDCIFIARQLQEKCKKQKCHLYAVFFDLTKAFDTVNREALSALLEKLSCTAKFVSIIRAFHDCMCARVSAGVNCQTRLTLQTE